MKLKRGVSQVGVQSPTWFAVGVISECYRRHSFNAVVTSITDGVHPDLQHIHYKGLAVDIRTRDIPMSTMAFIESDINEALQPMGFDVVMEKDHIHVEYDPKNEENWIDFVD